MSEEGVVLSLRELPRAKSRQPTGASSWLPWRVDLSAAQIEAALLAVPVRVSAVEEGVVFYEVTE